MSPPVSDFIATEARFGARGKLLAEQHDGIEADVKLLGTAMIGAQPRKCAMVCASETFQAGRLEKPM